MKNEYQICNRCIMDNTSDKEISFNEKGECNYCSAAINNKDKLYFPGDEGKKKIEEMVKTLKNHGKNKKYDCIMGLSGGLDSSYLAYIGAKKWGLRILAVHIDDGFDTDLAKENIANLCRECNIELKIVAPDAEQFNALTKAYILAEVPNIAIPQDNVLFACLYNFAKEYKVNYFLSGTNYALECVLQKGNSHNPFDVINIKDINKKFGTKPIDKLPFLSTRQKLIDLYFLKIKTYRPLDYIDYNKNRAIKELSEFCNFKYYEAKHLENTLTKIIQLHWFYKKFKVDKRRSHLSSLIVSNQMTRDEAIAEISKPNCNIEDLNKDIDFVLKTLDLPANKFEEIMNREGKQHTDYKIQKRFSYPERFFWKITSIIRS